MNDGSALPTLQVNERGSGGAGYGSLCVALGKEQLAQNELRYVARGARFGDNISTLRDGMRCTEGTLTFCWQWKEADNISQAWPPAPHRVACSLVLQGASQELRPKIWLFYLRSLLAKHFRIGVRETSIFWKARVPTLNSAHMRCVIERER